MMGDASRIQLAAGFILHQRPYRETSALLEVFTESHGRIGLIARGARAAKSRQRGELQPFRPLRLSWLQRGELGTLTAAEADGHIGDLVGEALYSAFYLNELMVRLLARQDPHPRLYKHYQNSLQQLAQSCQIEFVLRIFEKRLLDELGYGLLLDASALDGRIVEKDACYDYRLESGPVRVSKDDARGFLFKGSSLLALAREQLDNKQTLRDAKRLMRSALSLYLGGKPLKSRELFRAPGSRSKTFQSE